MPAGGRPRTPGVTGPAAVLTDLGGHAHLVAQLDQTARRGTRGPRASRGRLAPAALVMAYRGVAAGCRYGGGMTPRAAAVTLAAALALAGCSSSGSPAAPSASASGPAATSGGGSATPSPTAAALPETCQGLLPLDDLDTALGTPLIGATIYIGGRAEPGINRTGRVTCRYGVRRLPGNKTSPPKIEVGVSTYTDTASATKRVRVTVTGLREQGSRPSQVQVGGNPGTVLIGVGPALLVVATGTRTVAVSLYPGLVPGGQTASRLLAVGELAVKNLP